MTGAERLSIQARAREVAEELIGSCVNERAIIHEAEFMDPDFCAEFDSHVFECERCGWWCGADEERESMICEECSEGDFDDEY